MAPQIFLTAKTGIFSKSWRSKSLLVERDGRPEYFRPKNEAIKNMEVKIVNRSSFELPKYETEGSAGMDVRANIERPIELGPLERRLVPTGLFIELPLGFEAQMRPRSGLSIKKGLTLVNSPGTIDADYRGEICVPVINLSPERQTIEPGERIAQMIVARHERIVWQAVEALSATQRGAGGFGSTGAG